MRAAKYVVMLLALCGALPSFAQVPYERLLKSDRKRTFREAVVAAAEKVESCSEILFGAMAPCSLESTYFCSASRP